MKWKILFVAVISLVAGAVGGGLWASNAFKKFHISKQVDVAGQTLFSAGTLAYLRLGEVTNAIAELESRTGAAIVSLAVMDQVAPVDDKTRIQRDKLLTSIKVYYQSFPFKSKDTNQNVLVSEFLSRISGRSFENNCDSSVCRLDDLRIVHEQTKLNPGSK